MRAVLFAVCAMIIYAMTNVLYEKHLATVTNFVVMSYWSVIMLPIAMVALGAMKLAGQPIAMPTATQLPIVILIGVLYFAADGFYTGAYNAGGTLMTVTSITVMFPAFASVIKYYATGHTPNGYQVCGYVLALGAIMLILKGSQLPQTQ